MITFDRLLPEILGRFEIYRSTVERLDWLLVNRDLNGRIRLILPEAAQGDDEVRSGIESLAGDLAETLGRHAYPVAGAILFEPEREAALAGGTSFRLEGFNNVVVVDRLATEGNWLEITSESTGARRVVFFSIKGGVGRSTALAALAWAVAQDGKRVLVLDLDLESPGLSTAVLPEEKQPQFGITDWLVEDLVDNGETIFDSMVATSDLSHDGEILVVPAHGRDPGDYVAKLGRVWMPKIHPDGRREAFSGRLRRLIDGLEARYRPDIVLIDSRAGIDEVASGCVMGLGANLVLLFALEGRQTWSGYRILFDYWARAGVAPDIRERLQIVAALVPETDPADYLASFQDEAYTLFAETLYDDLPAGATDLDLWHFEPADEAAPHNPWPIRWHRGFAALRSLHGRLARIDRGEVDGIFGPLIRKIEPYLEPGTQDD